MSKAFKLENFHITVKGMVGVILAVMALVTSLFVPGTDSLSQIGIRTIGLLVFFLFLLVMESFPVVVTSLLTVGLMPIVSVTDGLGPALSGYAEKVVFFTLASFGLAIALTKLPLANRLLKGMLHLFGKSIRSVLFALMAATALVSSIISNVPTCAIFMSVALSFLDLYSKEEDKRKTGRAFMIAVPIASMIGGIMTPAGSSINLIAIGILKETTGETISFVQWMLAGIPIAFVLLPLAWILILAIYKPSPVSKEDIQAFVERIDVPKKLSLKEIFTLIITATMFILWVLSSWFPVLDVMVIAILGCVALMLPGIEAIDAKTFILENSWDAFFLVGCVLSIGNAMKTNGVDDWISSLIPSLNINIILVLGLTALIVFVSLLIVPVATSLIKVLGAPLIALALGSSVSPILVMLTAAICACNCYLLPLDTVPLITYSKGYYSMTDMLKCTSILQVTLVILCALWIPCVGMILGIA
jgi:sodium-dependent dicarboxylate transporter 2/3/5